MLQHLLKKVGLICLVLLYTLPMQGQGNYPVRIVSTINYPISSNLQDYSNPTRVPVKVNLQLQDLTLGLRNVFLKVGIQGPGVDIRSSESAALIRLSLLPGQLTNVPAMQLAQYFAANNLMAAPAYFTRPLPAGLYTFTFEAFDELTKAKLSDKITSPPVWVETNQPPVPIMPLNGSSVAVSQVQNVLFQWNPRHTQINDVEYEFILTELPVTNRGNIQNIFLSQPPIYKGIIKENNFLYGAKFPPLREGYTYAWRVQAKPKLGRERNAGTFVNDGIAEVFSFTYISPLKYPTEVKAAWGADFKNLGVTWKGDDAHQRYVVVLQQPNGQVIREFAIDKTFGNQYSYNIPNLSATTPYTIAIKGIDRFSRTAASSGVAVKANALADVQQRLQTNVALKGSVKWAFLASEEKVSVKDGLIDNSPPAPAPARTTSFWGRYVPTPSTPTRTTTQTRLSSTQLSNTLNGVKEATVSLYGTTSSINVAQATPATYSQYLSRAALISTTKTKESGEYSFDNVKISQLSGYSNFYLMVRYKDNSLSQQLIEVKIDEQATTSRTLGNVNLAASTIRYAPKIKPSQGKLDINQFEEIALYRLKPVFDNNSSTLSGEAGTTSPTELTYNNATYVQAKDLLTSGSALFDNMFARDMFVLSIKQKGRQRVIYPVNQMAVSSNPAEVTTFTDVFTYTPPQVVVEGLVAFGTKEKNQKAINHTVGVLVPKTAKDIDAIEKEGTISFPQSYQNHFVQSLTTDNSGKFSVKLPDAVVANKDISKIVLYAADPTTNKIYWAKVVDKPSVDIKEEFYLKAAAASVAGVIVDQYDRPVKNAFISHSSGASARTDDNGFFVLNNSIAQELEKDKRLTIKAEDYKPLTADLSKFTKLAGKASADLGLKFWTESITKFADNAKVEVGENLAEETFTREFSSKNAGVEAIYTNGKVVMESVEIAVKITGYTDNQAETTAFNAKQDETDLEIPEKGETIYVKAGKLELIIVNADNAETLYMEDTLEQDIKMPSRLGVPVEVKVKLREAVKVGGIVKGKGLDGSDLGPLDAATVAIGDSDQEADSDKEGNFETLVEKDSEEAEVVVSKKGFNKEKFMLDVTKKSETELKNLAVTLNERDKKIPDFKTLQGFAIELDVAEKVGDSYELSGSISLDKVEGAFKLDDEAKLTFTKLVVRKDSKNDENALVEGQFGKLNETSVDVVMFDYVNAVLDSDAEPLRIMPVNTSPSKGKISGKAMMLAPKKFLGADPQPFFEEVEVTLENNKQPFFDAFISDPKLALPTTDMGAEFSLEFPENVRSSWIKNGYLPIKVGTNNIYRLDMNPGGIVATEKGITFSEGGNFMFPLMEKAGLRTPAKIGTLVIKPDDDLSLKEISFVSRDKFYFEMPIAGWIFQVKKFQIMDNFKRFGVGGDLYIDEKSYLVVNTFNITKSGDKFYPSMSLNFSPKGLKIGVLTLKNSGEQEIAVRYKEAEGEVPSGYEVDAGAIMYCSSKNAVTDKIFPLEVERFWYNTAGGVYLSVKPGRAIAVGPIKINVRKLIFNKGTEEGWHDMMNSLASEDAMTLGKRKTKVTAKYSDFKVNGAGYIPDATLRPEDIEWAFGFAGGVQFEQLKGANFKSDVVMIVGDKGQGLDFQFGAIELGLQQSSFSAFAKIKIATSGEKVGFEGQGKLETMTRSFEAGLKFYKLPRGIEFGASVIVSTAIPTGPITWTKMGGGVDFNTQDNKYKVMFLGEATPTGTPREVTSFRNIVVSVLFDTNACGAKPVVEGSLDWFNKGDFYCNARAKVDFCRLLVLATIDCDKEIYKDSRAKINATVFFTPKSFFLGASIRANVLSVDVNGSLMLGIENNFYDSQTPQEVKRYANFIRRDYLDNNGTTLNGIYLNVSVDQRGYYSGNYWVASISLNTALSANAELLYSWKQSNFFLKAKVNAEVAGSMSLMGCGLNGNARVYLDIAGGRNNTQGWFFDAGAGVNINAWNDGGYNNSCNSVGTKWCRVSLPCGLDCCCGKWWRPRLPRCNVKYCGVDVPCGVNFKICVDKHIRVKYQQYRGGWGVSF